MLRRLAALGHDAALCSMHAHDNKFREEGDQAGADACQCQTSRWQYPLLGSCVLILGRRGGHESLILSLKIVLFSSTEPATTRL